MQTLCNLLQEENIVSMMDAQGISNDRGEAHLFECNFQTTMVQSCQQIIANHSKVLQAPLSEFTILFDPESTIPNDEPPIHLTEWDDPVEPCISKWENRPEFQEIQLALKAQFDAWKQEAKDKQEERNNLATAVSNAILEAFGPIGITLGATMQALRQQIHQANPSNCKKFFRFRLTFSHDL